MWATTVMERSPAKRAARRFQHGRREIDGYRRCAWMVQFDQGKQTPVSGAEIEDTFGRRWDKFQKGRLAFDSMRDRVGAAQVVQRVFG